MCDSAQEDRLSRPAYFKSHHVPFTPDPEDHSLGLHLPQGQHRDYHQFALLLFRAVMHSFIFLSPLITLLFILSTSMSLAIQGTSADPPALNLTAISAANGTSIFECWQLQAPFLDSNQAGTDGAVFAQLGNASNASLTILPPKFDGGLHNAPCVQ